MKVYVENNAEPNRWWVHMDQWQVSFTSCAEAEQFMAKLNARLNAPHPFDSLAPCTPRGRGVEAGQPGSIFTVRTTPPASPEA